VCLDGSVIINVAGYRGERAPQKLLDAALSDGGTLFIGVRLYAPEVRQLVGFIDEIAHEPAGFILGGRERRRRKRERRTSKAPR
jgi:hypothetical protein